MTVNKHEICQNEPNKFRSTSILGPALTAKFLSRIIFSFLHTSFLIEKVLFISLGTMTLSHSLTLRQSTFFVKLKITLYLAVYIIQSYVHLLDSKIA